MQQLFFTQTFAPGVNLTLKSFKTNLRPNPAWARARKFAHKSFDVACVNTPIHNKRLHLLALRCGCLRVQCELDLKSLHPSGTVGGCGNREPPNWGIQGSTQGSTIDNRVTFHFKTFPTQDRISLQVFICEPLRYRNVDLSTNPRKTQLSTLSLMEGEGDSFVLDLIVNQVETTQKSGHWWPRPKLWKWPQWAPQQVVNGLRQFDKFRHEHFLCDRCIVSRKQKVCCVWWWFQLDLCPQRVNKGTRPPQEDKPHGMMSAYQ